MSAICWIPLLHSHLITVFVKKNCIFDPHLSILCSCNDHNSDISLCSDFFPYYALRNPEKGQRGPSRAPEEGGRGCKG